MLGSPLERQEDIARTEFQVSLFPRKQSEFWKTQFSETVRFFRRDERLWSGGENLAIYFLFPPQGNEKSTIQRKANSCILQNEIQRGRGKQSGSNEREESYIVINWGNDSCPTLLIASFEASPRSSPEIPKGRTF